MAEQQRRFGPTLGAGVVVIERAAEKPIERAALGTTCYIGIMEKGPVGEVISCLTKKSLLRKTGGLIPESVLPDCAQDFFDAGQGAGALYLVRITDGTEVPAWVDLPARRLSYIPVIRVFAKNGGRWAGKKQFALGDFADLTEITVTLDKQFKVNELAGGRLSLKGVPGKSYTIIGNTGASPSVVTVSSDSKMLTDMAGSVEVEYTITLENAGKQVALLVKDGINQPETEWGLEVYVDGALTLNYENLSSDPLSKVYFANVINGDGANEDILVQDNWTGAVTADIRPTNYFSTIFAAGLTATTLKSNILSAVGPSVPAFPDKGSAGTFTYGASVKECTLILTCTDDTTPGSEVWSVAVDAPASLNCVLPPATTGVAYVPGRDYLPGFTIAVGGDAFVAGDLITVFCRPFVTDELKGGIVVPDITDRRIRFRIVSNTNDTITVGAGNDMTAEADPGDDFLVEFRAGMGGGYNGIAGISSAQYISAMDPLESPINQLFGKGLGLVKLATPGIYEPSVQMAGLAYAESRNYQFRVEVPPTTVDEVQAEEFINDSVGRSDFGVAAFPSYAYVSNPEGAGLKLIPMTGMIHGREALVAKNYNGYHKAAAGVDVTLPRVVKLTTGNKILDEEFLNPHGIQVIKFKGASAIIWGDRTISSDSEWRWKHQREQMSFYENIMREEFDWIVFAINDPRVRQTALSALRGFFLPEFANGALSGDNFQDACQIKLDDEINTPYTASQGDLLCEIKLRLADTVERFIITMSKAGIFEAAA